MSKRCTSHNGTYRCAKEVGHTDSEHRVVVGATSDGAHARILIWGNGGSRWAKARLI